MVKCNMQRWFLLVVGLLLFNVGPLSAFTTTFGRFHATKSASRAAFSPVSKKLTIHPDRLDRATWLQAAKKDAGLPPRNGTTTALHSSIAESYLESTESLPVFEEPLGIWQPFKAALPSSSERQKIIPLGLMLFCILFNYTILRSVKDVLVGSTLRLWQPIFSMCPLICSLDRSFNSSSRPLIPERKVRDVFGQQVRLPTHNAL